MTIPTSPICWNLGIRYPIFGFSHSPEVIAEIARAGGFGVLGLAREMPEDVPGIIARLEAQLQGLPYGVDLMLPQNVPATGDIDTLRGAIPPAHKEFVSALTGRFGLPAASKPGFFTRQVRSETLFNHQIEPVLN